MKTFTDVQASGIDILPFGMNGNTFFIICRTYS